MITLSIIWFEKYKTPDDDDYDNIKKIMHKHIFKIIINIHLCVRADYCLTVLIVL